MRYELSIVVSGMLTDPPCLWYFWYGGNACGMWNYKTKKAKLFHRRSSVVARKDKSNMAPHAYTGGIDPFLCNTYKSWHLKSLATVSKYHSWAMHITQKITCWTMDFLDGLNYFVFFFTIGGHNIYYRVASFYIPIPGSNRLRNAHPLLLSLFDLSAREQTEIIVLSDFLFLVVNKFSG